MNNKCEWKDGKFEGCKEMESALNICRNRNDEPLFNDGVKYCAYCGADIRKPEPEKPLIVKSGETWVAHWKGVDYLCIVPEEYRQTNMIHIIGLGDEDWKPFSEIELTDEIAKLRPIVYHNSINKGGMILWGVSKDDEEGYVIVEQLKTVGIYTEPFKNIRLATPHELQKA